MLNFIYGLLDWKTSPEKLSLKKTSIIKLDAKMKLQNPYKYWVSFHTRN
jgi:hypothetical protein